MKVVARRREGFVHEVDIEEGAHTLLVDEPAIAGGQDAGPSPTRLVAAGLASCIAITMEMYAERKGWDVGPIEVEVDVEYEGYVPRSFSSSIRLPDGLSEGQRQRLLAVAAKCPVHKVLAHETEVTVSDRTETL